ncbi:GSCOCG00009133001-RA-CDS [Cotesia congregata]|uniref:Uncharacterized protein n=1 Tax=Cotesia congregata TaxID=51543 RepID=A0A8J2MJF1_COTCN|nr:GSCOCG00009133001-RA-CDS [Cotesia congregata]CAG5089843.1 Protein of unknown function [Cotesia congregata]
MFTKIVFIAIVYLYFSTELHGDKIDDALEEQKVKLSKICVDLGYEFACALDETCVPSCANDYLDVQENKCQYINKSIYDFEMVEFFECKLPNYYSADDFGQCEGGSCVRIF